MARIRTIKPDFFTDAALGECSMSARLTFVATWVFADDYGNLERSARQLKAQAFPYDSVDIEQWMAELVEHGLLIEYESDGKKYLHIKGFERHQRVDRKSEPRYPRYEGSPSAQGVLVEPPMLIGREGNGREIEGKGVEGSSGQVLAIDPVVITIPLIDGTDFEVRKSMRDELDKLYPAVDPDQTLNEIRGWNLGKENRRKTRRGIKGHIYGWFKEEQDKQSGGANGRQTTQRR